MEVAFELDSSCIVWLEAEGTEIITLPNMQRVVATGYLTYIARYGYSQVSLYVIFVERILSRI